MDPGTTVDTRDLEREILAESRVEVGVLFGDLRGGPRITSGVLSRGTGVTGGR